MTVWVAFLALGRAFRSSGGVDVAEERSLAVIASGRLKHGATKSRAGADNRSGG